MEIQSGNGDGPVAAVPGSTSTLVSGPRLDVGDEQALREEPRAAKTIEKFHIPLDSLKRMFEKPPADSTVSTRDLFGLSDVGSLSFDLTLRGSVMCGVLISCVW